jgi:hypothetical protein
MSSILSVVSIVIISKVVIIKVIIIIVIVCVTDVLFTREKSFVAKTLGIRLWKLLR